MSDWNYLTVHCQLHRNFRGWLTVDLLFFVFKIFIGIDLSIQPRILKIGYLKE